VLRSIAEIEGGANMDASKITNDSGSGQVTPPQHLFKFVLPVALIVSLGWYSGLSFLFPPIDYPGEDTIAVSPVSANKEAQSTPFENVPGRSDVAALTFSDEAGKRLSQKKESAVESKGATVDFYYVTVQEGETLSSIARRLYGDSSYFDLLYAINRDSLDSPDDLKNGQKIRVPL